MAAISSVPCEMPDAVKAYAKFAEGKVKSAKPRRGALLYKKLMTAVFAALGMACAWAGEPVDNDQPMKLLFLGNSITWHPPAAEIGWSGNWGMAASTEDKDYVHQMASSLEVTTGVAPTLRVRSIVAGFEGDGAYRTWTAAGDADYQADLAFAPDVVVIAIGENVGTYDADEFRAKFLDYCSGFTNLSPRPRIVIRGPFWRNNALAAIEQSVAEEIGARFADIADIGDDVSNRAVGLFAHDGVASHPGDKGMNLIARRILEALDMPFSEISHSGTGVEGTYVLSGTGSLVVTQETKLVRALLVGGGGSGGWFVGGGGGAGEVRELVFPDGLTVAAGTVFSFSVGEGGGNRTNVNSMVAIAMEGAGFDVTVLDGMNGQDTTLSFADSSYVARGGGGGAGCAAGRGLDGACGGGGANVPGTGGTGSCGGNGGCNPAPGTLCGSGGGGGVGSDGHGANGQDGRTTVSGTGGAGIMLSISGEAIVYGAGGGGGGYVGVDSALGGGAGAGDGSKTGLGGSAQPSTGSGGGGGGYTAPMAYAGGRGGSGTIVLVFSNEVKPGADCTGAVRTVDTGEGTSYIFSSDGTFVPNTDLMLNRALVVGGGGSGGWMVGGGGGGGGVVEVPAGILLRRGVTYNITVGAGGGNRLGNLLTSATSIGFSKCVDGEPGQPSTLTIGDTVYTAPGGGGGASWFLWSENDQKGYDGNPVPGGTGACGGGSCGYACAGGIGTLGCNGGASIGDLNGVRPISGGGGGMASAGQCGSAPGATDSLGRAGVGGMGYESDISGEPVFYGAGGGGGGHDGNVHPGLAGSTTAGAGNYNGTGFDAAAGSGGGGGGGGLLGWGTMFAGGNGGSGTVILSVCPRSEYRKKMWNYSGQSSYIKLGDETVIKLSTSGDFVPTRRLRVTRALLVGGGGAGGWMIGGGGGGGGVIELSPSAGHRLVFDKDAHYPVQIGAGGTNQWIFTRASGNYRFTYPMNGSNGGATTIRIGETDYSVAGGGGGAGWLLWHADQNKATDEPVPGGDGACGGGSCGGVALGGTGSLGYNGGSTDSCGGGGGGMGGAGETGAGGILQSGAGGAGYICDITGESVAYGAGGGGGGMLQNSNHSVPAYRPGAAGAENAGAGNGDGIGGSAVDGFGGGGGGGSCSDWNLCHAGGKGGSGSVILVVKPAGGLCVIIR